MIGPLAALGARVAPLVARALSAASWASLGWVASDATNVATGTGDTDQETTKTWRVLAGGGAIIGALLVLLALKLIPNAEKRLK